MSTPRRLAALAIVALLCATYSASAATSQSAAAATASSVGPGVRSLVATVLDNYAGNNNKPTQRYYASGVWYNSDNTQNWASTQGGAALAAASQWSATGRTDSALRGKAIYTITTAMRTAQNADGSFSAPPAAAVGPAGAGVTTEFFARMFGDTYLLLQSSLTDSQRKSWATSLARAADYLISNRDVTYYANGNVNLGYAQTLYLAWRATGYPHFASAYDAEWSFLLNPDQALWPGFGLRLTTTPTRADGADGAGYLAEKGIAPDPGFDAEYTMVQLTEASDLYAVSRDPRALRLANLLMNVLRPRISSSMQLDTSGGTRHTEVSRTIAFTSSAPAVLAWLGGRDDLAWMVQPYVDAVTSSFMASLPGASNPVYYGALGVDVAGMLRIGAPGYAMATSAPLASAARSRATGSRAASRSKRATGRERSEGTKARSNRRATRRTQRG